MLLPDVGPLIIREIALLNIVANLVVFVELLPFHLDCLGILL